MTTDAAAFTALYREHRDAVWRYARRRLPEQDAVEDVVTEVFETAWRRRRSVPDPALPWLYGVARRVLANQRRAASRRAALRDRAAGHMQLVARDPADSLGARDALATALASLADADREVLLLVAWEGLTDAELATALGCRRGAARTRLHRARARLQVALGADDVANPTAPRLMENAR